MKAVIVASAAQHQSDHARAMKAGLGRHGIEAPIVLPHHPLDRPDFVVTWGWRRGRLLREQGHEVLVMERGYIADRFSWTSLGWNGLNGRARFAVREDGGQRFDQNFGGLMKPWRRQDGYALLIGQVIGDAALLVTNISLWYAQTARRLREAGYDVRFRRHPLDKRMTSVNGVADIDGSLHDALAGASLVVTWNSNTGVESVLAGVPTVAMDQDGSMAAGVSSGTIEEITPHRYPWASDMAWKQFTVDEIASGFAWEVTRDAQPLAA